MTPPYINGGMTVDTLRRNAGGGIVKSTVGPDGAIRDYGYSPGKGKPPAAKPAAKPTPVKKPVARAKPVNAQAKYINDAVNRLGVPMTDQQIQTNASGQLSPIIAALTASIGRQASAGTQAISGYTSNLQQQLAPFQQSAANIYGGAEQSQAASDAALSAKLQGEGGQQAQDLGARLASINAPGATNAAVSQATTDATGAGNALYGTGSASLANLIAAGAAEQSYAGKLPGIAGLSGLQQTGNLQAQLSGKLADQTGELQAKVPDIVAGLQGQRSDLLNRRENLRQGLNSDFASAAAKKQALAQERQALGLKTKAASAQQQWKKSYEKARLGIAQQSADASTARVRLSEWKAAHPQPKPPKPPTVQTTLSAANHYLTDTSGNPILKNGKKQPYKGEGTGAAGAPSATTRRKALSDADLYFFGKHPVLNKDGTEKTPGIPGIGYNSAVQKLMVGYGLSKEDAKAIADTYYKGHHDRGFPYPSKQAAFKAKISKPPQVGATVKQPDGTYVYDGRNWVKK